MTANLIGQTIDRYKITALLGRGGMATVYRAHDTVLRRDVALKVLYAHFASDAASVARFEQEAVTAARLEHPHIVPIYDVGHVGDLLFISMKLLTGQSFHDMLAVGGALDGRRMLLLAEQVAGALDYAHSRGVVHRDIKPANIFIERAPSADGTSATRALLTDFGIAKSLDAPGTTSTGMMIGTPDYMAPEQIQGQPVDARADVYAFGMVLYRALSGRLPFSGNVQEVLLAQLTQTPSPPSRFNLQLTPAVDVVLLRALAKRREDRYASAGALVSALRDALHGRVVAPPPDEAPTLAAPPPVVAPATPVGHLGYNPRTAPAPARPTSQGARAQATPPVVASGPLAPAQPRRSALPLLLVGVIALLVAALFGLANGLFGGQPATGAEPSATLEQQFPPPATSESTPLLPTPQEATPAPTAEQATAVPEAPTLAPTNAPEAPTLAPTNAPEAPTPAPTNAPQVPLEPTPEPTLEPTPEPTPDPVAACGTPDWFRGSFAALWASNPTLQQALGCPGGPETAVLAARRNFQFGTMLWVDGDQRAIYALISGRGSSLDGWSAHQDTYQEGEALAPVDEQPTNGLYVPERGFGKLWRADKPLRDTIGFSTEQSEHGPFQGAAQPFAGGRMVWVDDPGLGQVVYILYNSGAFERVPDPLA